METRQDIQGEVQGLKPWPNVAIIILNWNGWRDTIECLESLQRITYPDYYIIVVDNGSTDDSVQRIKEWAEGRISINSKIFNYNPDEKPIKWGEYDKVAGEEGGNKREEEIKDLPSSRRRVIIRAGENLGIVQSEIVAKASNEEENKTRSHSRLKAKLELIEARENLGFTGGNNVGIKHAVEEETDYVLLLNNDTVVSPDFLTKMVATAEGAPPIGIVGCKIYYWDDLTRVQVGAGWWNPWFDQYRPLHLNYGDVEVNFVSGCAMLIKKTVFEIGLLEEKYFLYVDDVDFSYRAIKAGWKLFVNLDAKIWHKASASIGRDNMLSLYYVARNWLYFITERLEGLQKISSLCFFLMHRFLEIVKWLIVGKHTRVKARLLGIKDFLKGKTGKAELRF